MKSDSDEENRDESGDKELQMECVVAVIQNWDQDERILLMERLMIRYKVDTIYRQCRYMLVG